jgi:GT2 family glycosyltransferase
MKLVVIIATYGRKELLDRVLTLLENQSRLPDEVIVSAPDKSHVLPRSSTAYMLTTMFGDRGSCLQRNRALDEAVGHSDIITFFDDDFLPAPDYIEKVENAFRNNPDWAVLRGDAILDGAKGPGIPYDEGLVALNAAVAERSRTPIHPYVSDHVGGYGCNMSVRSAFVEEARFDERLPLYGWQEDIDFSGQLRRRGRVVGLNTLFGVHLGAKSGRVSGVRLGYSQIINPVYLVRKGTIPTGFAFNLIWRNIAANLVKSLWSEPYIDRRGRLKGNILGALHLVRGKIEPEHILKL